MTKKEIEKGYKALSMEIARAIFRTNRKGRALRMWRHAKSLGIVGTACAAMTLTGCSIASSGGDHVTLTGTPAGIQAFADLSNGLIRTGKEQADQPSEFFTHRKTQEVEASKRIGFWQKLVE